VPAPARGPPGLSAADAREFERLVRRFESRLLAYARNRIPRAVQSTVDPQDIVQEAFISAFLSWGRFDPGRSAPRWLMSVARNRINNLVKANTTVKRGGGRAAAARTPAKYGETTAALARQKAAGPGPEESASAAEAAEFVERLISGLPPDRRQAIRLHFMQGLRIGAVAEEMGRSNGSVLMLCSRGLEALRKELWSEA